MAYTMYIHDTGSMGRSQAHINRHKFILPIGRPATINMTKKRTNFFSFNSHFACFGRVGV